MDKFGSVIDRMDMKLGGKFLNSLRIKTQLLKRLQRVIVVDGATHSQKDGGG
jgi:aspartate carbamoyltransferase regulatory subunit